MLPVEISKDVLNTIKNICEYIDSQFTDKEVFRKAEMNAPLISALAELVSAYNN